MSSLTHNVKNHKVSQRNILLWPTWITIVEETFKFYQMLLGYVCWTKFDIFKISCMTFWRLLWQFWNKQSIQTCDNCIYLRRLPTGIQRQQWWLRVIFTDWPCNHMVLHRPNTIKWHYVDAICGVSIRFSLFNSLWAWWCQNNTGFVFFDETLSVLFYIEVGSLCCAWWEVITD